MRPVTLLLVAPCAALWFGCAPRPVGWDAERASDGVVSTRAPIDLVLAYPLDAPAREYAIEDGADAGATLRREFLPRSDGLTELRETLADPGEIVSIVVLSLDETGGVVIHGPPARVGIWSPGSSRPCCSRPLGCCPGRQ